MFVFTYRYPDSVVHRIFNSLVNDTSAHEDAIELKFPNRLVDVKIPKNISKKIVPISQDIGESMNLHGFRFFLNSKTMLKSLALMNGRKIVSRKEFQKFIELKEYFNFNFNEI